MQLKHAAKLGAQAPNPGLALYPWLKSRSFEDSKFVVRHPAEVKPRSSANPSVGYDPGQALRYRQTAQDPSKALTTPAMTCHACASSTLLQEPWTLALAFWMPFAFGMPPCSIVGSQRHCQNLQMSCLSSYLCLSLQLLCLLSCVTTAWLQHLSWAYDAE